VAEVVTAAAEFSHCASPTELLNQLRTGTGIMRAEIQTIVAEIKQSIGLLRRHL
jgi:hypothetical protein